MQASSLRIVAAALVSCAAVALTSCASPAPPPAAIEMLRQELETSGSAPVDPDRLPRGLASLIDVSDDGVADWKLDYGAFGFPAWCGTGGCRQQLWVSGPDGHRLAFDAHAIEIAARPLDPGALDVELHGTHCNRPGNAKCSRSFRWDASGGRLAEIPNRRGETLLTGPLFQPVEPDAASLPVPVASAVDELRDACTRSGGRYAEWGTSAVFIPDIDGDGERDWIVQEGAGGYCETDAMDVADDAIASDSTDAAAATDATSVAPAGSASIAPRVFVTNRGALRELTAQSGETYEIDIATTPARLRFRHDSP